MINPSGAVKFATAAALLIGAALMAVPLVLEQDPPPAPAAVPASGLAPQPGRYISAWLPYWKADAGLASFTANSELFTDLTTFFHYASGPTGELLNRAEPGQPEAVVKQAQARGVVVLAAVLDDTSPGTMRQILLDPATRAAHIAGLLPLVDQLGYDGIDIDYENFAFTDGQASWPEARPAWVAFISELAAALDARGKYLTVAVPPQFNAANDDSSGYWVYDWPAIAPIVDMLRVMTYDYSVNEPGPIAPLPWVERATAFGVATLGPAKFRIGVPTYGRDWVVAEAGTGCPAQNLSSSVTRGGAELLQIAAQSGAAVAFDPATGESSFSYLQNFPECVATREVHVSDASSVAAKATLALANGTGIALWSLGGEDPAMWEALHQQTPPAAGSSK